MLKIAITGNIGSGKSLCTEFFSKLGVPIFDTDQSAKDSYYDPTVKSRVINILGSEAYGDHGINKKYIASKIFTDDNLREKLNAIIHPAVRKHFNQWSENQNGHYVIQESALVFESNIEHLFDKIITVAAPIELRLTRVTARDNTNADQVRKRMESQLDEEIKIEKADFVIHNDDSRPLLPQILEIHHKLLEITSNFEDSIN